MVHERQPNKSELTTEDWLKEAGFKWHQFDRQPDKQWLLWLGGAIDDGLTGFEDLGIEVSCTLGDDATWHCWLRRDTAGRYSRFIHIRHLKMPREVIVLIEALTGQAWAPSNNLGGSMYSPARAARIRAEKERLDHRLLMERPKWSEPEQDDTRGRALPEHMEEAVKRGGAR